MAAAAAAAAAARPRARPRGGGGPGAQATRRRRRRRAPARAPCAAAGGEGGGVGDSAIGRGARARKAPAEPLGGARAPGAPGAGGAEARAAPRASAGADAGAQAAVAVDGAVFPGAAGADGGLARGLRAAALAAAPAATPRASRLRALFVLRRVYRGVVRASQLRARADKMVAERTWRSEGGAPSAPPPKPAEFETARERRKRREAEREVLESAMGAMAVVESMIALAAALERDLGALAQMEVERLYAEPAEADAAGEVVRSYVADLRQDAEQLRDALSDEEKAALWRKKGDAAVERGSSAGAANGGEGGAPSIESVADRVASSVEELVEVVGGLPGWLPGALGSWRNAASSGGGMGSLTDASSLLESKLDLSSLTLVATRVSDSTNALWLRLNGRKPPLGSAVAVSAAVAALPRPVSEAKPSEIRLGELIAEADELERSLSKAAAARERALRGAKGGSDRLARARLAGEMKSLDDDVSEARRSLAVPLIEAELERVYSELESEALDYAEAVPRSDEEGELLLAEFGLLDAKAVELRAALEEGQALDILDDEITQLAVELPSLRERLGLPKASMLYESAEDQMLRVRTLARRTVTGVEDAVDFYARGGRMLVEDLGYSARLVGRAVRGTTLRPREVLALRRTGTDLLALPVCTVILIIPLTPVGHVLVFSFIQKVFPGFFPSQFSEERQETYKRYEAAKNKVKSGASAEETGAEGATMRVRLRDRQLTQAMARAIEEESSSQQGLAMSFDEVLDSLERDVMGDRSASGELLELGEDSSDSSDDDGGGEREEQRGEGGQDGDTGGGSVGAAAAVAGPPAADSRARENADEQGDRSGAEGSRTVG